MSESKQKQNGAAANINQIIERYGDTIYDLCQSSLHDPSQIRLSFTTIIKDLKKSLKSNRYQRYERSWVLRMTCDHLRSLGQGNNIRSELSESEHFSSDTNLSPREKLQNFDLFFLRLPMEQRLVLLLCDKYKLEPDLISAALALPEDSVKLIRVQSLNSLEEWIWA